MKIPDFKFLISNKKTKIVLGIFLVLILFLVFAVWPAVNMLANAKRAYQQIGAIKGAYQSQDLEKVSENIKIIQGEISLARKSFNRLRWIKFIPFLGKYWNDGDHLFNAGDSGLDAGVILIEAVKPYADILGFKGGKGFSGQTAEERVVFVVQTLEKISPQLEKISLKLNRTRDEIKEINPKRYPKSFRGIAMRDKIVLLQGTVNQLAEAISSAKPALAILPQLLGEPDEKQYLLLFQNNAELRPTGGFMTAYAILKVYRGKITPLKSEDIYSLDARFNKRLAPPEPIKRYLPLVYYWHLRDMNLSPDFKNSMDTFSKHYQETAGTAKIDGIIAIDTKLPVELLKILGPIGVGGWGTFSAENDPNCNCPQVIYELEKLADKPVGEIRTARKAVLGPLMYSILLNVMGSPRKLWPEFFNVAIRAIKEKHLLLYFFDDKAQKAAEDFNAAGRIKDYEGDYLAINDCNFAGAKSNMFIKESVDQKIEVKKDGTVVKTLTIDYKNPQPPSNCNLEKGGLCLNGPYRNWFRIYVPKGSRLLESNGSEIPVETKEDLGKTVFEGFFGDKYPLRPLGAAKVVLKYVLPFKVSDQYNLLIQKQPGTDGYKYSLDFNGQKEEFELKSDKEVKFKTDLFR